MQFTDDSLSRALAEFQGDNPLASRGSATSYTFDAEDNRTKIDDPLCVHGVGFDPNETRDALSRISAITNACAASIASFDLHVPGLRKTETTFGNTTTASLRLRTALNGLRLATSCWVRKHPSWRDLPTSHRRDAATPAGALSLAPAGRAAPIQFAVSRSREIPKVRAVPLCNPKMTRTAPGWN